MQNDRTITISTAGSRRATDWQPQTLLVSELWARLKTPARGKETLQAYLGMKKAQQDGLKDVGGFVGGDVPGRRKKGNVRCRDLVTLDLDNLPPGSTGEVLRRCAGLGIGYCVYSTRKHSPDAPRLRIVVPTDRALQPDEYEPVCRKLAELVQPEMTWFDPTTFQLERLMYWPSCCADGEYIYAAEDKPFLYAAGMLGLYSDWRAVTSWPAVPGEAKLRDRSAAKQGDPTAKGGVVGAFCRIYDVPAAMDKFLPGTYTETDTPGRYTFTGGSTAGGAVLYDDGKFLYSHHSTDPCSGALVNAFDLVRLHKFGELDDAAKEGTPVNRLPSHIGMCALAREDPECAKLLQLEAGESALADFQGIEGQEDKTTQDLAAFLGSLENKELTTNIVASLLDALGISFRFEEVSRDLELGGVGHLGWSHENAANNLPVYLRDILRAAKVKGASTAAIAECLAVIADEHRYNAVQRMIENVAWDNIDRLEGLYEIVGVTDGFSKTLIRKWLMQCVALAFNDEAEPYGADGVLAFQGPQGLGKTSVCRRLAVSANLFVEGACIAFKNKDSLIKATSAWIVELGELEATIRDDSAQLKAFITETKDNIRLPYGRTAVKRPRRTSFCGTVNQDAFLRDITGNRRFWTVPVQHIDLGRLFSLPRDWFIKLWAQVYEMWGLLGTQSFRLTRSEQEALEIRNKGFAQQMQFEQEILDVMDFSLPEGQWRWVSPARIAAFAGQKVSATNVGLVLSKIAHEDPRMARKRRNKGVAYWVPLNPTYMV
ncbi:VapE domain-containing protein [Intestinibacillus massiliensis]|uniref:VapE domain-containing protein n=1 Tax=Intestinibacillus massiliensis TaxID=1871029 RepID=UPI000B360B6E|nr:VapE domain-containing protein [Intestinibacillus massiliensis]